MEFVRCEHISGKLIANEIIRVLEKSNLEIKIWREENDGPSNIPFKTVGVKKPKKPSTLTVVGVNW